MVDIRRIGNSYTCLEIPPATQDSRKDDIFLPPTVGLSGRKITAGSSILASGYSMPFASVNLNLGEGKILTTSTDVNGYYKAEISDLPSGKYTLFATARYENKDSEKPERGLGFEVLGILQSIPRWFVYLLILLILAIIILIIILFWKRRKRNRPSSKASQKDWKIRFKSWLEHGG